MQKITEILSPKKKMENKAIMMLKKAKTLKIIFCMKKKKQGNVRTTEVNYTNYRAELGTVIIAAVDKTKNIALDNQVIRFSLSLMHCLSCKIYKKEVSLISELPLEIYIKK